MDLNRGSQVSEATTLHTEPQPMPCLWRCLGAYIFSGRIRTPDCWVGRANATPVIYHSPTNILFNSSVKVFATDCKTLFLPFNLCYLRDIFLLLYPTLHLQYLLRRQELCKSFSKGHRMWWSEFVADTKECQDWNPCLETPRVIFYPCVLECSTEAFNNFYSNVIR